MSKKTTILLEFCLTIEPDNYYNFLLIQTQAALKSWETGEKCILCASVVSWGQLGLDPGWDGR